MKKKIALVFVFGTVFASFFLFGCKNNKIEFYRESQAAKLMDKFSSQQKSRPTTSSGMVILKDDKYSQSSINFGPKDINFDMPSRYGR